MNEFLSALGAKLAERWVSMLVLPGALYLALAATASTLGHRHALDWHRLSLAAEQFAGRYDHRSVSAALLAAAVVAAAAAVGLLARGLGALVERLWTATGPAWLTDPLVRRRHARWTHAKEVFEQASPERQAASAASRNAIALAEPVRPTWIGDRLREVGVRVQGQYGLDFAFTWPRLWLILPETCRSEVTAAREALTLAATQCGWGVLYLTLGTCWWPAAPAGALLLLLGTRRGHDAAGTLADLTESAFDLYAADLARALGAAPPSGIVTPSQGRRLSEQFRKGA